MRASWPLLLAVLATAPAPGGPELDAYRAMAANTSARTALLDAARAGLMRALGDESATTTTAPDWPGSPRPLYVTLVRGRATRACVGSDAPAGGSLGESLARLGEQVVASDRRHPPLRADELDTLRLVIAFAGDPQPVSDPMSVDPVREGLKIESAGGAVAFLPGEARTVAWALREARRIGVLSGRTSDARFSRFSVVSIQGPARVRANMKESAP